MDTKPRRSNTKHASRSRSIQRRHFVCLTSARELLRGVGAGWAGAQRERERERESYKDTEEREKETDRDKEDKKLNIPLCTHNKK
jgi:hypothetical protein